MLGGYTGKMLFVDLTSGELKEKELTEELAWNFLGGYGLGAKILYEMMPAGTDPLGPDSVLGFIPGPAPGTKAFFSGRYTIVHKSPVTGGWNDANSGGYFGPELKKAGYDAVFVSGIAQKPVYLWISDGKAEIRDASHLWGKDAKETWAALQEETGDSRVRVVTIGPAGERMALISCPINDGHRAPGRGGGGAVMGSKRLKAIAVRGTGEVSMACPDKIVEINKEVSAMMKGNPVAEGFGTFGTGVGTGASALSGDSPVKNWGGVGIIDFGEESAQKVTATTLDKHKTKKYSCYNCPLGCGAEYEVKSGRWPLKETERPEYETAAAFGSTLLCDEEDAILKANEICNRYGLDTISAGMTIAWAMECYDKGVLTPEDLDGIDLTWGNGEAIVALLQKMADGEGCGAVLAHGSAYAAKAWGKGSQYLQTASGIELPMHDPRLGPGLARTYQYDPTPGRHVKGGVGLAQLSQPPEQKYNYQNTGAVDLGATTFQEVLNCLGFCMFAPIVGVSPEIFYRYTEAITGLPFTPEDSFNTGLRILNMRQAFNLREGIKPADCTISDRAVGKPPLTAGPLAGVTVDNEQLGRNFFATADWDLKTGKPSLESLQKLGYMDEVIKDLYTAAMQ
ncbi:MAG TPA: aldehyde ferredoxin oxidoreductase family protein [Firmicutes bacterium]|nr:aldehyde ferredoxin oxidoreductase family protein [Bacillota bacterium]